MKERTSTAIGLELHPAAERALLLTAMESAETAFEMEANDSYIRVGVFLFYPCTSERGGPTLQRYLLIALGGALGAIARYEVGVLAAERFGVRFSLGTLLINISACFLIGFSLEFLNRHTDVNPTLRYLIPIGFIGAYSTFSTFEWEIWTDFTNGAFWIGVTYLVVSIVAGLLAVALGSSTARSFA